MKKKVIIKICKMKTTYFIATIALAMMLTGTGNILAQPASKGEMKRTEMHKGPHNGIPNLTEEQKTKIKDLHVANYKETKPLRNQLGELKAKQRTLTTADKPDLKAIDANIDEITKVMNQLMKSRAAFHQQVRALLTDEQKMWFDTHPMNRQHGNMRGHQMGGPRHQEGGSNHQEGLKKQE
jgi:Spy/CpxP family protein refolding chaperone